MKQTLYNLNYDTKWKFCSYWHQIVEIAKCFSGRVLQVGIGNKFIHDYLAKIGINIFSIDIEKDLSPGLVASVLHLPFKSNSYDVVACFEVLEHLRFEDFLKSLSELHRVAKHKVILSLPDVNHYFVLNLSVPFYGIARKILTYNFSMKKNVKVCHDHYWEIGLDGYPLSKIMKNIQKVGFFIEKQYRVFENPYHRFFVLKKQS